MLRTLRLIRLVAALLLMLVAGCATTPPRNPANLCAIFNEKDDWYSDALTAARHWRVPVPVIMAIINQESSFVDDARPARTRFLGIPLWRPTSAFGYSQAKDETWDWYIERTGNSGADRDDFDDAVDFVAWYVRQSTNQLGIPATDAYRQYLAYHDGLTGYRRGTWRSKPGLLKAARRVAETAARYDRQLSGCRRALDQADAS